MIEIRQETHGQVMIRDHAVEFGFLFHGPGQRAAIRVPVDHFVGLGLRAGGNRYHVILFKQVPDDRSDHHAGSKDEDFFHRIVLYRLSTLCACSKDVTSYVFTSSVLYIPSYTHNPASVPRCAG